jgi:hypothetical protein
VAEHLATHQPPSTVPELQADARFLAEASRLLADSLDYEATLATVARLSLPYLGAWCIVDLCTRGVMRRAANTLKLVRTVCGTRSGAYRSRRWWRRSRQ